MTTTSTSYKTIVRDGLWDNNATFNQLFGMCPLMAVTTSAASGLGMGLTTMAVLTASNVLISPLRNVVTPQVRIAVFIAIISTMVTVADLVVNAFMHDLYKVLGLFIALIVTNCLVLGRAETFASRHGILPSFVDGIAVGIGFTWALTLLGACRELLANGTVFAGASVLLGKPFAFLEITVIPDYKGFLLMILPPGGFLVMGFLAAGKRLIDEHLQKKAHGETIPVLQTQS